MRRIREQAAKAPCPRCGKDRVLDTTTGAVHVVLSMLLAVHIQGETWPKAWSAYPSQLPASPSLALNSVVL
jgi:hypothetical protein